ncbi:hypothetical protein AB0D12_40160 [Streptomyces sp. NPDC048479]|uniref:hypothetical protein n=1 Tax=Streptomyces sp. NPDC048479 TaxID=3154725 RepID=UPI0034153E36
MTTPPLTGQPYYPPHPSYPPPAPPRARRALIVGMVVALALLLLGGAATAWWLSRDEDGSALAGRPRVTDTRAGLSYAILEHWEHDEAKDKDLISGFSSQITRKAAQGEAGGTVFAGRSRQVIPPSDLQRQTEFAARSNAEFFFPDQAVALEESRSTTVSGHPAHTVWLRVKDKKGGLAHLRLTLVTVDDKRSSFVLGIATGTPDTATDGEVDAVMESTKVT